MANLASIYRNQGRWKEAEELEVRVMETRKKMLGEEHSSTLTSRANLASIYRNQGRWKEAEELEVRVMETRKWVLDDAAHTEQLRRMMLEENAEREARKAEREAREAAAKKAYEDGLATVKAVAEKKNTRRYYRG
jgi:hypothetical protein